MSSESKIPVSRTENYLDPMAGIEGRRTKKFFDVDKDDVLFVGSDAERELIVKGSDGSPMSVRFESPDLPSKPIVREDVPADPMAAMRAELFRVIDEDRNQIPIGLTEEGTARTITRGELLDEIKQDNKMLDRLRDCAQ